MDLQNGPTNADAVSTPLCSKLPSIGFRVASPGLKRKGRACEEWTLRHYQTNKCNDAEAGDLGVLTTHEASSIEMAILSYEAAGECRHKQANKSTASDVTSHP